MKPDRWTRFRDAAQAAWLRWRTNAFPAPVDAAELDVLRREIAALAEHRDALADERDRLLVRAEAAEAKLYEIQLAKVKGGAR